MVVVVDRYRNTYRTMKLLALWIFGMYVFLGDSLKTASSCRRQLLGGTLTTAASLVPTTAASPATPTSPGEAVRRLASDSGGYYGPSDIFYPDSWKGLWKLTKVTGDETPVGCYFRFLDSIESNAVVADRGYNAQELERALGNTVTGTNWSETNPNVLTIQYGTGGAKEIKVTQRATEREAVGVFSSEVQRITDATTVIPTISAQRTKMKWKETASGLEAIELVYSLGGDDPMQATNANQKPTLISKSRLFLERP